MTHSYVTGVSQGTPFLKRDVGRRDTAFLKSQHKAQLNIKNDLSTDLHVHTYIFVYIYIYGAAKTHRMPYLYGSFSAKEPHD